MQTNDHEPPSPPSDLADDAPPTTSAGDDARTTAISEFVWQPPRLDPALRPQVFASFDEDLEGLPDDMREHCDVFPSVAKDFASGRIFSPGIVFNDKAVVFLVGDLSRHLVKMHGGFGGRVFEDMPSFACYHNETLGVVFITVPRFADDVRALAVLLDEVDRYKAMQRSSVQFGPMPGPEGTRLWWEPAVGNGTLGASNGKLGTIIACADGQAATPSPELRAEAIKDLCMALTGLRRYNGRSKINVARHSLLVGELVRRRGIQREPRDKLSPGRVLEVLATFLGAAHDLPGATGDGDIATPLTRLITGPARVVRNAARAMCFHLVGATRQHGTVDDLAAIFPIISEVDTDASALEYGWCFGCAPVWLKHDERRTALAEAMVKTRAKLKREPSLDDERAGGHLAAILTLANTATSVPDRLLEALEDHPFTAAALEVMSHA